MRRANGKAVAWALGVPVAMLLAGGVAVNRWGHHHVYEVTGRTDVSINCMTCHGGFVRQRPVLQAERGFPTPVFIAEAPDGQVLVSCESTDEVAVLDPDAGVVRTRFKTGRRPYGIAVSPDGQTAYVAIREENRVAMHRLADGAEVASLRVGRFPGGLAISPDGQRLVVANLGSDDISLVNLTDNTVRQLAAGREPYDVTISPDGTKAFVANRLAADPMGKTSPTGELTIIDLAKGRVVDRPGIDSAHLCEGLAVSPADGLVAVTTVRVRNLVPILQVGRGWVMNSALAVYVPGKQGLVQFPLDDLGDAAADPAGVVLDPARGLAYVASGGGDVVSVVDWAAIAKRAPQMKDNDGGPIADDLAASLDYLVKRIPVAANPKGMKLSADGKRLYVAERLGDSVAVIDPDTLEVARRIPLTNRPLDDIRRGEKLFHSAKVTFESQFSCRSCHPDGHQDGLTYDFAIDGLGDSIIDNRSLLGLAGTEPLKWAGTNKDVQVQCGIRFAKVLTMSDPIAGQDLEALAAYINSLPPPAPRLGDDGQLTAAQERGKTIFERTQTSAGHEIPIAQRCTTCHMPPLYTNHQLSNVGTFSPGNESGNFDTPHLLGVGDTAPYLHDGRASTLEEIWTVHSPEDTHGIINDLTKEMLNDLVEYLRSL